MPNRNTLFYPTTSYGRKVRAEQRFRRRWLRTYNVLPSRIRKVLFVELDRVVVPEWAKAKGYHDLSITEKTIWLIPRYAKRLAAEDAAAGGVPVLTQGTAIRCEVCNHTLMGSDALARQRLNESSSEGRKIPCSDVCVRKGKKRVED